MLTGRRCWRPHLLVAVGEGVVLVEGAQEAYPYRPVLLETRLHVDGSMVDR